MRDPVNISGVASSGPDFMGFIFYPKSSRHVGFDLSREELSMIPYSVKKVGVFVDEMPETMLTVATKLDLYAVQLHGSESPGLCHLMQSRGLTVIKAFALNESFDFTVLSKYQGNCDYFLFDTKSNLPGGSGQKFNWQLLDNYRLDTPFFLSGGIGMDDLNAIREFNHPLLFGIDINSSFEISPALKDVDKVKKFILEVRS